MPDGWESGMNKFTEESEIGNEKFKHGLFFSEKSNFFASKFWLCCKFAIQRNIVLIRFNFGSRTPNVIKRISF